LVSQTETKVIVHAQDNGELECVADGFPLPNITWYKNGVRITNISYSNIWIAENALFREYDVDNIHSRLTIGMSDPSNSGNYTCTAANSYGSSTRTFSLVILTGKS